MVCTLSGEVGDTCSNPPSPHPAPIRQRGKLNLELHNRGGVIFGLNELGTSKWPLSMPTGLGPADECLSSCM